MVALDRLSGAYDNIRYVLVKTLATITPPATRTFDVTFRNPVNCVLPGNKESARTRIVVTSSAGQDVLLRGTNLSIQEPLPNTEISTTMSVFLSGNTLAGQTYGFEYASQDVDAGPNILYQVYH